MTQAEKIRMFCSYTCTYVDDSSPSRLIKVPSNKPTLLTYHDNNKYLMNPCELSNLIGSPGIKYMADITNRTHSFII